MREKTAFIIASIIIGIVIFNNLINFTDAYKWTRTNFETTLLLFVSIGLAIYYFIIKNIFGLKLSI